MGGCYEDGLRHLRLELSYLSRDVRKFVKPPKIYLVVSALIMKVLLDYRTHNCFKRLL